VTVEIGQFNSALYIYSKLTRVVTAMKFGTEWAITRLL